MHRPIAVVAVLLALVAASGPAWGQEPAKDPLDAAFEALLKYDWGKSRAELKPIDDAVLASHGKPDARKDLEQRLIAVLKAEAPRAAKDYACRQVSLVGTAAAVEALAALLSDKDLSHMARYALERIPEAAAVKAMRDALPKASGAARIGVINSLGVRRDAESVKALIDLLKDKDAATAGAAAAALGKIGGIEAIGPLKEFRTKAPKELQTVAVDATLDLAERLLAQGKKDEAGKIYDELNADGQPALVRKAAFQGLVAVRPAEATPRLMAALSGQDAGMRALAVRLIEDTPGEEATKAFAAQLGKLPPDGQAALLGALRSRRDPAARSAVLGAIDSKEAKVKLAAIQALAAVGSAEDVPTFVAALGSSVPAQCDAARRGLAELRGEGVNGAILAQAGKAKEGVRADLIRSLSVRAAREAAGDLLAYTKDASADVRKATLEAMGVLAGEKEMPALVDLAKAPKDAGDMDLIETAMKAVATRAREKAAPPLLAALKDAPKPAKLAILRTLPRVGGAEAMGAIVAATKDADAEIKDAAVRALTNWPDADAADAVLAIAKSSDNKTHQVLALRGYVRLVQEQKVPDDRKAESLGEAMKLAGGAPDKKLVLGALGGIRTAKALALVTPYIRDPGLSREAAAAAVGISNAIWRSHRDLVRTAMQDVTGAVKDKRILRDAGKILGQVGPKAP